MPRPARLTSSPQRAAGRPQQPLGWGSVTAGTLQRYGRAVKEFLGWVVDSGVDANDEYEFDELVLNYIQDLYGEAQGRTRAESTLYGITFYLPGMKGRFPRSQQALRGWAKATPAVSHPPLSWELACAVAAKMAATHGQYHHAVGVLLSFDCFLRISELCGLQREDVADTGDKRMGALHKGMLLRIRRAKTGANQTVRVHDPAVQALVRGLVRSTPRRQPLFPFKPALFRLEFHRACAALRLSDRYVPHSLRHGGATHWHNNLGRSMEDIMHRGRWASSKAARIYIQQGPAVWMEQSVPAATFQLGLLVSRDLSRHMGTLSQVHGVGVGCPRPPAAAAAAAARRVYPRPRAFQ